MFGNRSLTTNRSHLNLSPWSIPLDPFNSLRDDVMDIFDNFTLGVSPLSGAEFVPRIEIKDNENAYIVAAEVPGMSEKDMNVSIRDNCLILEGEKKAEREEERKGVYRSELSYGSFYRAIPLSDDVDPEKVSAAYKNGILRVTVEKRPEAQRKTKKIPITLERSGEKKIEAKH